MAKFMKIFACCMFKCSFYSGPYFTGPSTPLVPRNNFRQDDINVCVYLYFRQSPLLSVKIAVNEFDLCCSPTDYPNGKWRLRSPLKHLKKKNYMGKIYQGTGGCFFNFESYFQSI